jgi:hypothetical protein
MELPSKGELARTNKIGIAEKGWRLEVYSP